MADVFPTSSAQGVLRTAVEKSQEREQVRHIFVKGEREEERVCTQAFASRIMDDVLF